VDEAMFQIYWCGCKKINEKRGFTMDFRLEQLPFRIHPTLFSPEYLNQYSSKKQIFFILECVRKSFYGRFHITPSEWIKKLSTSYDVLRKMRKYFSSRDLNILSKKGKQEYELKFYREMTRHDGSGEDKYIKGYSFLFERTFQSLPLSSMRAVLYCLYLSSRRHSLSREPIKVDVSNWYGHGDNKLFPLWHKSDMRQTVKDINLFFSIDDSYLEKGQILLYELKSEYREKVEKSLDRYEWMERYLQENANLYYWHDFHLKHLVGLFSDVEEKLGFDTTVEAWNHAFFMMNFDHRYHDKAERFYSLLNYIKEDTKENYSSEAVALFRDTFLIPSLIQLGFEYEKEHEYLHHGQAAKQSENTIIDEFRRLQPQLTMMQTELGQIRRDYLHTSLHHIDRYLSRFIERKAENISKGLVKKVEREDFTDFAYWSIDHLQEFKELFDRTPYAQAYAICCREIQSIQKLLHLILWKDSNTPMEPDTPGIEFTFYNWLEN
jgi:hypothetical protein